MSRNADSACPFFHHANTKRGTLSQHFVTHVVPPLGASILCTGRFTVVRVCGYSCYIDDLNLMTVCKELEEIQWKRDQFCVQLGVPYHKLQEYQKRDDPFAAAIAFWLNGNVEGVPVSWSSIQTALRNVNEKRLADHIGAKYCQHDGMYIVCVILYSGTYYIPIWPLRFVCVCVSGFCRIFAQDSSSLYVIKLYTTGYCSRYPLFHTVKSVLLF